MSHRLSHDWFSRPLPDNLAVGERSWLYSSFACSHYNSNSQIGVRIGSDTGVYHGTFFDLGPDATVEIGDYCSLVGVIISTNGGVSIGDYTFIAHEVVIADCAWATPMSTTNVQSFDGKIISPRTDIRIGQNVWIGAQTIVVGSIRIGDGAVIGAGTLVTRDVPPDVVCAGNPMRIVKTILRSD
jgi:acetyltransferase-like isoleucine patch superfamily enzyme